MKKLDSKSMAENNDQIIDSHSFDFIKEIKCIIDAGRTTAYAAVNTAMITTYWNIGRRIGEEEQHGQERAE